MCQLRSGETVSPQLLVEDWVYRRFSGSAARVGARNPQLNRRRAGDRELVEHVGSRYVHGRDHEDEHALSSRSTRTRTQPPVAGGRWAAMDRSPLDFERLDVYRCAIDFLALAVRVTAHMPRGQSDLRDQLRRASTSVPLNIAEASGK